ncbi:WSC-domain-containing protein [Glonium stellatum]|uniref:WSC-domain-containing protein n=1 Tax=Glonium stellatum TaxID=574774 RepID=A0A8E2EN92_9PEZI|nr:WSC-domain-containing protein [Glonium stellatum]
MAHSGQHISDDNCQYQCTQLGYNYAGVEYSGQCYCDNHVNSIATQEADSDCNMPCTGVPSQPCGGPDRMNLFWNGQTAPPPPETFTNPGPDSWVSEGCYTDSVAARTLANQVATTGGGSLMTIQLCASACKAAGYLLAGAEYAGQCYCDNTFINGGPASDQTICSMKCSGNSSEYCGGAGAMNLYSFGGSMPVSATPVTSTPASSATLCGGSNRLNAYASGPGWVQLGCYTDQPYQRTLANNIQTGTLTVEICLADCQAAGYALAGVEYGQECHCGNSFDNGGGPAPDGSIGCSMACNGNATEICGGSQRLSMYGYVNANGTISTTVSASPNPTPTPTPTPTPADLPTGWSYSGCYVDNANGRILAIQQPDSNIVTIESCISTCSSLGYSIVGLEYSTQCFCGNEIIASGVVASADSQCAMQCSGNSAERCGGPDRMSIYTIGIIQVAPAPAVQTAGLPSTWTYQGCLSDDVGHRTFPDEMDFGQTNSAITCLNYCASQGYSIGGMEYGAQCCK